jgi:hypothetical protein
MRASSVVRGAAVKPNPGTGVDGESSGGLAAGALAQRSLQLLRKVGAGRRVVRE